MTYQLVRAACQVLEQKLRTNEISGRFVVESYSLVREILGKVDISNICKKEIDIDKKLVDDLGIGLYMTAIVEEEIKDCLTPHIIQSFRQAVLSVFKGTK